MKRLLSVAGRGWIAGRNILYRHEGAFLEERIWGALPLPAKLMGIDYTPPKP
jgi:hypothetical protein